MIILYSSRSQESHYCRESAAWAIAIPRIKIGQTPKQQQGLHTYSCATCHHAEAGFQSGMSQAISEGGNGFGVTGELRIPSPLYSTANLDVQPIRTPTVLNTAYSEVILWNGSLGGTGVNLGTEANWKVSDGTNNNFLGMQGLKVVASRPLKAQAHT